MPMYEYNCKDCNTTYEILHMGPEVVDDVVCPNCQSKNHKRLMSVTNVGAMGSTGPAASGSIPSCAGGCCGGACGLD